MVQLLTCPDPGRREKINLNISFQISLWCLKRFYEGLKGYIGNKWVNLHYFTFTFFSLKRNPTHFILTHQLLAEFHRHAVMEFITYNPLMVDGLTHPNTHYNKFLLAVKFSYVIFI